MAKLKIDQQWRDDVRKASLEYVRDCANLKAEVFVNGKRLITAKQFAEIKPGTAVTIKWADKTETVKIVHD